VDHDKTGRAVSNEYIASPKRRVQLRREAP